MRREAGGRRSHPRAEGDDPRKLSPEEVSRRRAELADRFRKNRLRPEDATVVDANAFAGNWPFRSADMSVDALVEGMDEAGVDRAVVSSLDAVLYRNCHAGNRELATAIDGYEDRLVPFATINPDYAEWRDDLAEAIEELGMQGVKLLPGYHDYGLDEPTVEKLVDECAARDVPVAFCAALEDQQGRHPRVSLRGFPSESSRDAFTGDHVDDLVDLLLQSPDADVILANTGGHAPRIVNALRESDRVWEGTWERPGATLFVLDDLRMRYVRQGEQVIENVGAENLVCGPQLPFKYFESYYVRVEHLPVSDAKKQRIRSGNLDDLL